jgi:peroxiredoxin
MKKKRTIKIGIGLLLAACLLFFTYQIVSRAMMKKEISEHIKMLPEFRFYTLDEKQFTNADVETGRQALIIYFSPDCDHCQSEAQELGAHLDGFANTRVLMISGRPKEEVIAFAEQYKLKDSPVTFLLDRDDNFFRTFGRTGFPICFMYGTDHKLLKVYEGETKAEAIQKVFGHKG